MSEEIRQQIMTLIEAEIPEWDDDQPPRHALSTLWGKVRELPFGSPDELTVPIRTYDPGGEPLGNFPPADELADVRDRIAALKAREATLRTMLLSDPSSRQGNKFLAEIVTVTQQRVDLKELRAMHADLVAEYTFPHAIQNVELRAIDPETGEITRRPKRRA
jgi:hypothetical protein